MSDPAPPILLEIDLQNVYLVLPRPVQPILTLPALIQPKISLPAPITPVLELEPVSQPLLQLPEEVMLSIFMGGAPGATGPRGSIFLGGYPTLANLPVIDNNGVRIGDYALVQDTSTVYQVT